ncbi:cobalamin biosynthesis protein CbiX [Lipingzhangella sp. LS1_29]|uniref:Cobalamin biosynthesis protein CbiX n=1 Tax=Lipingzhangella rawalii TaxID=2055835 RepID=A0ABU2HAZ3_9ACTN|nr:cobalamin biosynthesis protein CbiX [Lipingzhangella rawalii]MDS1272177.1 cobalamin biosynthesis protein CbiX [Lipingzhangella rawalii]
MNSSNPSLVLVAADRGDAGRRQALDELARATERCAEAAVHRAFGSLAEVLATVESVSGPRVLIPVFLAGGDQASARMCAQLPPTLSGNVIANDPLGVSPALIAHLAVRVREAGWEPGDGVVLLADAAGGAQQRRQVAVAAQMLRRHVDTPVHLAHARRGVSSARTAVHRLRRSGYRRVVLAPWRLVPGPEREERELRSAGADAVAAPLWPAQRVVDTVLAQHRMACARLAA